MSNTIRLPVSLAEIEANPVAVIEAVMARVPLLSAEGFEAKRTIRRPGGPTFAEQRESMTDQWHVAYFVRAAQWLAIAPKTRKARRRLPSSYGWKHVASRWHEGRGDGDGYMCNGAFIAACYALGRDVAPIPDSPNAWVDIADRADKLV